MKVTIYLRSGQTIEFKCAEFKCARNLKGEMTSWEASGIKGLTRVSVSPVDIEAWTAKRSLWGKFVSRMNRLLNDLTN